MTLKSLKPDIDKALAQHDTERRSKDTAGDEPLEETELEEEEDKAQ